MRRVFIPEMRQPPAAGPRGGMVYSVSGATMGTTWSCKYVAEEGTAEAAEVRAGVESQLRLVNAQMSNWDPDSCVSRFNRARGGTWHEVPDEFAEVLACAVRVAKESDGAYDPTVGPAVDLWGFGPSGPTQGAIPDTAAIARVRRRVGWLRLRYDAAGRRIYQPGGVSIDLSSIAKGYAVDLTASSLGECGVKSYLIEIGGELKGRGVKPDGQPWWVALEHGDPPAVVALYDLAVATSGEYRRNFVFAGRTFGHTIDPRTCHPIAAPEWLAVSVLHSSCMAADAYATAAMVFGRGAGRLGVAARMVPAGGGAPVETSALRAMLR